MGDEDRVVLVFVPTGKTLTFTPKAAEAYLKSGDWKPADHPMPPTPVKPPVPVPTSEPHVASAHPAKKK